MRFLVTTEPKFLQPPEALPGLLDALVAWAEKYRKAGKFEAVWSRAGAQGGGGIANVDSLEELNEIMVEFPFGPFYEIHILPITDLKSAAEQAKRVIQAQVSALSRGK
jgi:muconolactone delta-isomerase